MTVIMTNFSRYLPASTPSGAPVSEVTDVVSTTTSLKTRPSSSPNEEVRVRPTAKPNSHQSVMPNSKSRGRPSNQPVTSKPVEESMSGVNARREADTTEHSHNGKSKN